MPKVLWGTAFFWLITSACVAQQPFTPAAPSGATAAAASAEEAHFTPEQLKEYYLVYTNSDVHYLRTLFDAYLAGKPGDDVEYVLLKKWSPDYFRSKFVVFSRDRDTFGGTLITLMFQDRPDKIFVAWIYAEGASQRLTLRAFEPGQYSDEQIKEIKARYGMFLEDKVHAM